jgi:hypothetical protein
LNSSLSIRTPSWIQMPFLQMQLPWKRASSHGSSRGISSARRQVSAIWRYHYAYLGWASAPIFHSEG